MVDPDTEPVAYCRRRTVKNGLDQDVRLVVLEPVAIGDCHMVPQNSLMGNFAAQWTLKSDQSRMSEEKLTRCVERLPVCPFVKKTAISRP